MKPSNSVFIYQKRRRPGPDLDRYANSPDVVSSKLEALKLLAASMLAEVASMRHFKEAVSPEIDLALEVRRFETGLIRCALVRTGGNQRKAARLLHIKPSTLHEKMKRYGILKAGTFKWDED